MRFVSVLMTVLLVPALLCGAEGKTPMSSAPPAELSQLAFFSGTWSCSGIAFATPFGPEHATGGTAVGSMAVGGRWMHIRYDEKKSAANPMPIHAAMYIGWDEAQKKFVEGCVDSLGGYCTQSSSGWNNDTLAFEGSQLGGGQKAGARETFVRKGSRELVHYSEVQTPDGKWMKIDQETCRKAK